MIVVPRSGAHPAEIGGRAHGGAAADGAAEGCHPGEERGEWGWSTATRWLLVLLRLVVGAHALPPVTHVTHVTHVAHVMYIVGAHPLPPVPHVTHYRMQRNVTHVTLVT